MTEQTALSEFFEHIYVPLQLGGGSESTLKKFRQTIAHLERVLGRQPLLCDLSDDLVAAACNLKLRSGRSPATANGVRGKLHALWTLAAKRRLISSYPSMPRIKEYHRVPTAWSQAQLQRLWHACRQQQGEILGIPAADWWSNLHGVIWDSGVRIGALVAVLKKQRITGIAWDCVDLQERTLLVIAEHQKQRGDQRFLLHADTAAALDRQRPKHAKWVFPWPWCECTLYNHYVKILKRAGLPAGRRDKFHRMRRTVASWYEAAGGNATDLLGHSSRKVTLAYLDPIVTSKQFPCNTLFRIQPKAS